MIDHPDIKKLDERISYLYKDMDLEQSKDEFDRANDIYEEIQVLKKERDKLIDMYNISNWC